METKQLASINLNSSQLQASKSAALAEASGSKQQSPFEARLDKQIKQLRESGSNEDITAQTKNDKNQRDSASELDSNMREKSISRAREEQKPDKREVASVEKIVLEKNENTEKTDPADVQPEAGESLKVVGEAALRLPLTGILLPLSEKNFQGLKGTPGVELFEGAEKKLMATELPAQIKLAAERINGLNQGSVQVTIPNSGMTLSQTSGTGAAAADSAILAEQAVIQVPVQTALNQTDKVNRQFDQLAQVPEKLNGMSAADIIAQATRLLQVPAATALSKSLVEGGAENSLQQVALQTPVAGVTGSLPGTATSVGNLPANNLTSTIGVYLASPDWSNQMTQKVSMMLQGGIQKAEIKLNPAHLGPMEIKLSMSDDRASISFMAQHAPVRDAIEQAMPRLREMLEEQGLGLADVDVSAHSEGQAEQQHSEQQSDEVSGLQNQQALDTTQMSENMQDETTASINLAVDRVINIYA